MKRAAAWGSEMTLPTRYFINLTQPEIAAQLRKNPLVILPAEIGRAHV